MDYVRCPSCSAWNPPVSVTCSQCGAALGKSDASKPPTDHQAGDWRLESAADLRRISSKCWGVMWVAFIVQLFASIGVMQLPVDEAQVSSAGLAFFVFVAIGLVMASALLRLADAVETSPQEKFFAFIVALVIPLAALLMARNLRVKISKVARRLESDARANEAPARQ
jgi:hypothetical protein